MNPNKILLSSINPSVPIILASGSESRRVMLEDAGLDFKVSTSDVNEDILKKQMIGIPFEKQVIKLASAKAEEVSLKNQDCIVIGGDQMCVCNNTIFDKPGSVEKAIKNLQVLSGTTHYQYSGICIFKNGESLWDHYESVEMNMHKLSDEEILAPEPVIVASTLTMNSLKPILPWVKSKS